MTWVGARWFTATSGRAIDVLVLHSMEIDEKPTTAEACARYFATTSVRASAHACVDNDSRVDCVLDRNVAYAAPGANHNGLQLEQAGRARQSRTEWLDPYSRRMIVEQTAAWVAEKAALYAIPLVSIHAEDLKAGRRGVTTHAEVSKAFRRSTHTDPGGGYPMDVMLEAARALGSDPEDDDMTNADRAELLEIGRLVRGMNHQITVPEVGLQSVDAKLDRLIARLDALEARFGMGP